MKNIKRLLLVLFILTVLAVGGLLLSLNSIVEKLRPEIETRASAIVGTNVKVGHISSSLFPSIQVELTDVAVGNGDFQLAKALLAVPLADLIKGKLNVSAITLDSLKLSVQHSKEKTLIGGIDLSSLKKGSTVSTSDTTPAAGPTPNAAPSVSPTVTIKRISLQNSQISLREDSGSGPISVILEDLNAEFRDIDSAGHADVDLSARILGGTSKNLVLRGVVGDPKKNFPLDLSLTVDPINLSIVQDIAAKVTTLPVGLRLTDSGDLKVRIRSQDTNLTISPELSLTKASVALQPDTSKPAFFSKSSGTIFELHGDIVVDPQQNISSKNFSVTLGKSTVAIPFSRATNGSLECSLQGKQIQLGELVNVIQMLQEQKLTGETDISLNAKVNPGASPTINGVVGFRNIAANASGTEISGFQGNLEFSKDTLTVTNLGGKLRDISLTGNAVIQLPTDTTRLINLRESELGLFGGKVNSRGTYSLPPLPAKNVPVAAPSPALPTGSSFDNEVSFTTKAAGLDVGALSKTFMANSPIKLLGRLQTFDLSLTALAKDPKQTSRGTTNFVIADGMIEGLNVISQSFASVAKIPGVSDNMGALLPQVLSASGSAFQQLKGSATIAGPNINLSDISLYHELYEIHGSGTLNTAGSAELKTQVKLLSKLTSQMLAKEKKLSLLLDKQGNMIFPVTITKNADRTIVLPDFQQLLERAAGNTAKDAAGKALDKVAPGLGGATKGLLDKLF